jgi:hypothetical protein
MRPENYFKGSSRVKRLRKAGVQSVHRRTGMESYRGKATGTMLFEQG